MSKNKENQVLSNILDINKDACDFYKSAIQRVENPQLQRSFAELDRLHSAVIDDLTRVMHENGGTGVTADGTLAGKTAKYFTEFMSRLSKDVDETLVVHLEQAEDRCLHSIHEAIDDEDVSAPTRELLTRQLSSLQRSHDHMKALKDSMTESGKRAA